MEDKTHILVVDVETTGLDPVKCSVIEIGAVGLTSSAEFTVECRMGDDAVWEEGAAKVHERTIDHCTNPVLPTEIEALELFLDWCDQCMPAGRLILAGMNPQFDLGFLRAIPPASYAPLARRLAKRFSHRTIDMHTLAVAEVMQIEANFDLKTLHTDGIYEMLEMDHEPKPHRAIVGARMEAQAIREFLGL